MNIDSNNVAEQDATNQYLSCVQLKLDCETICSLVKSLQQDGVTGFGVMPYITLTAYTKFSKRSWSLILLKTGISTII